MSNRNDDARHDASAMAKAVRQATNLPSYFPARGMEPMAVVRLTMHTYPADYDGCLEKTTTWCCGPTPEMAVARWKKRCLGLAKLLVATETITEGRGRPSEATAGGRGRARLIGETKG